MSDFSQKAELAQGFSVVLDACAALFLDEPTQELVDEVASVAASLGVEGFACTVDDDLKQRYYDRLFVTSTPHYVPLLENSILRAAKDDGGTMRYANVQSELTDHVVRCYHAVGFDYAALQGFPLAVKALHPDSLASELAFLAFACKREAECWESGDGAQAEHWASLARQFAREHPRKWVAKAARCLAATDEDVYARTCALAAAAIDALLEEDEA